MKIKLIAIITIIFYSFLVFSQEQIVHEKRMWQSPEGKIYIQKLLPVYFRVSVSPDPNAASYLIKSERTPQYSNPMYFDVEGWNSFRSPSAVDTSTKKVVYPEIDIVYDIYADGIAPHTSIKNNSIKSINKNNSIYLSGNIELTLIAKDDGSGVENIYYSINSAAYSIYKEPIKLDQEIEYTIKYYSVDNVRNVETPKTVKYIIDKSAPVSKIEIKGDLFNQILSGRSAIKLSSMDEGIKNLSIYYRIDSIGNYKLYTGDISMVFIAQGQHTISYYAVDNLQNKEKEQKYDFYVDKLPPTLIEEMVGKSFVANGREYSSGRSKLKIISFDNKSGVKEIYYSINGSKYELYDKPVAIVNNGTLNVSMYAVDNVNNKSQISASGQRSKNSSYVDLSGPQVNYSFSGPIFSNNDSVYIGAKTKIILKANDSESGFNRIEYQIDNSEIKSFKDGFVIPSEGRHTIKFYAYDNVDNVNSSDFSIIVDTTGPEIYHKFSTSTKGIQTEGDKSLEVYPKHVVLFLSATDKVAGYENMSYSLNGLPSVNYTGQIKDFIKDGIIKVKVKSKDKIGNETQKDIEFVITLK